MYNKKLIKQIQEIPTLVNNCKLILQNRLESEQMIGQNNRIHHKQLEYQKQSNFLKPYNDISAFFIQPNSLKNNIITSVSDVTDPKNPTIILLLVPFAGYILIRSKETRFQFSKSRQALSFCFIVILISSIVITPLSISSAYWHAYAED